MRKWINTILIILLLAGGAILCAVRWQAWFGMPPEPKWTGDTIQYTMPCPTTQWSDSVTVGQRNGLTFIVLGDIHNRLTREDYDTLAARVPQADAVIQIGDWLERGQDYYYQLLLREWKASQLADRPVIACPGNHEYSKGLHKCLSPVWEQAFAHPHNGPAVPGASYYLDLPSVRLITIDTNPLTRIVYLTRTLTWLREAMYTADGRYIVVIMHHPVLSPGQGRFNPLIYASFRHALGEADLVLAGHDHSYMRRTPFVVLNTAGKAKPQFTDFPTDATDTVPVYGVLQITNHQSPISNLQFNVYRLDDATLIDSLHVTHD